MSRKYKIGFASTDWSRSMFDETGAPVAGGANWVRLQQSRKHSRFFSVSGFLVNHDARGLGVIDQFNKTHYDLDIIVMQRLMFGKLVPILENRKSKNQIILNDLDDWYWGLHEDNDAYKLTHPDHNKFENINFYKEILVLSDGVTVSTPFLQDRMEKDFKCKSVHLIENCVDISMFKQRYHRWKRAKVGWVGSTSHRSGDLELLEGVFNGINCKLHHSGHIHGRDTFCSKVAADPNKVSISPMHSPKNYARLSFEFDIGIAPLNDIPFNHAKSWIKPIEYAAANIPVVMSDVGEYRRLHDEYGIGRLASTKEEWISHITELTSYEVRVQEAAANKKLVQELDVKVMSKNWDNVFATYLGI